MTKYFTEDEWELFTGLYNDALEFYRLDAGIEEGSKKAKELDSIRDKLNQLAPHPLRGNR